MISRWLCCMFLASAILPAAAQTNSSEPKDAMEWFTRTYDQMALRSPGSTPFHMKVTFHAFPGVELIEKKNSQIITGDGVYEETWLAPHQWRREVTFGSYHAIEVQAKNGSRKMQFSSDYEPSRVLMLLDALMNPIRRDVISPSLHDHPWRWDVEHRSAGGVAFIRISSSTSISNTGSVTTGYVFLPNGLLVQSNDDELVTSWQDHVLFAGKVVPKHLSIQAEGARNLLTAEISVEAAGNTDPSITDIPGEKEADVGMTLRPLRQFEVKAPVCLNPTGGWITPGIGSNPAPIFRAVIDRHGLTREVELISDDDLGDMQVRLSTDFFQHLRYIPAKIDGSPTEIVHPIHVRRND